MIDPFDTMQPIKRTKFEKETGIVDPFDVPRETAGQTARQPGGVLNPPQNDPRQVSDIMGIGPGDRETRATKDLPELGSGGLLAGEDKGTVAKLTPLILATTRPEEIAQIITTTLPHIGVQQDDKGNILLGNNKTGARVVVNQPGLSKLDLMQGLGITAMFTPGAAVSSIPKNVAARMALGGATAGLTEAGIQKAQESMGGDFDKTDVALATTLGAVAEGVVPGIQKIRQSSRAKQFGAAADELEEVAGNITEAQAASKATDIPLFQAQQTAVPAQLEKQSFIGLLPAGTRKASQELKKQNKAVSSAVDDFLSQIAPDQAVVTGPEKFRTAAQRALKAQDTIRKEASSPFYKEAFKQGADVDLAPVTDIIKQGLDDFPAGGEVSKSLLNISELISGGAKKADVKTGIAKLSKELKLKGVDIATIFNERENAIELSKIVVDKAKRNSGIGTDAMKKLLDIADNNRSIVTLTPSKDFGGNLAKLKRFYKKLGFVENKGSAKDFRFQDTFIREPLKSKSGPSLNRLHNAKLEIDQMLEKFGDNSLGRTTKAKVMDVKTALLDQMDDASDLYRQARETFAAQSPAVNQLESSVIGKVSAMDDTQLKNISKRIFDPAETNPAVIRQAKKVINDVDPGAWNELLRSELERRMGSIKSTLAEGTTENVPGQMFNAIFGPSKSRAVLYNALDGDAKANLKFLETALKRASLGRPGGSQTATREEIKKELSGGISNSIREFFSNPVQATGNTAVSTLTGASRDAAFTKRTKAMAEALFDPAWKPRMNKLRKLNPNSPAAARAMTQLLNDVEKSQEQE